MLLCNKSLSSLRKGVIYRGLAESCAFLAIWLQFTATCVNCVSIVVHLPCIKFMYTNYG